MDRRLHQLSRFAPALPAALALVVFVVWIPHHAGQDLGTWAPGGLVLLALLLLSALVLPGPGRRPRGVWIAVGALAGYTAWSFLSVSWADDKGDAWDGANRTLLYLVVFALFALWRRSGGVGAVLLGLWTLALGIAAVVELLAIAPDGHETFADDRLLAPAGYANADAALWLMALWPALVLASRRAVPWWARGLFAGTAVVLADISLLNQSRGGVIASAICIVLLFALVPGRVRLLVVCAPVAAAIALTGKALLDGAQRAGDPATAANALAGVAPPVLVAAAVVGGLATLVALLEHVRPPSAALARRAHRVTGAAGLAGAVAGLAVALVLVGNPVARAGDAWRSFKHGYGTTSTSSRLVSGLGSGRYDFYRVSLELFTAHPLAGVGADNFQQDYAARGRSDETPHYPHSLELRTLAQTGVVGAVLLLGAIGAALGGAWRTMRRAGLAGAVAGGAAMAFLYWLVHGSADWLWEYAGLGAPAWALLGLACAGAPLREAPAGREVPVTRLQAAGPHLPLARGWLRGVPVALLAVVAALSLGAPWLAQREYTAAGHAWTTDPARAFRLLDAARRLNPLSDRADDLAATIALRQGDAALARLAFAAAAKRNPRSSYAALGLGAIASSRGDEAGAAMLLARAGALDPRDQVIRALRAEVSAGRRVNLRDFDRRLFLQSQAFAQ